MTYSPENISWRKLTEEQQTAFFDNFNKLMTNTVPYNGCNELAVKIGVAPLTIYYISKYRLKYLQRRTIEKILRYYNKTLDEMITPMELEIIDYKTILDRGLRADQINAKHKKKPKALLKLKEIRISEVKLERRNAVLNKYLERYIERYKKDGNIKDLVKVNVIKKVLTTEEKIIVLLAKIDISYTKFWRHIESEKHAYGFEHIYKLSRYFQCPLDDFIKEIE